MVENHINDAAVHRLVEFAGPQVRYVHQQLHVPGAECPGMAYALSAAPVDEAHVAQVDGMLLYGFFDKQPFPERGIPDESGHEDLVTGIGVAEYLFQPVLFRQHVSGKRVGDAEPLGGEPEVYLPVDAVAYGHLKTLEDVVGKVGPELPGSFWKEGVVLESGPGSLLEVPVIEELASVMLLEEGVYGVLALDRQVHARQQVEVAVCSVADGLLQQGELASHDAHSSPADPYSGLNEDESGVSAGIVPSRLVKGGLPVHVDEDVVARVIEQREQLSQLSEVLMRQYQVCVTFHLTGLFRAVCRKLTEAVRISSILEAA